jgi:Trypsin-co-occurring domain 1
MSTLMIVELPEGKKLYFGGGGAETGLADISAADKIVETTTEKFKSALGSLGELVKILEESVGTMPKRPDKVEMEFGASLKGECDLWIVSGEGEADFKVKLSWERNSSATEA